jgi:hypothetical protein
MMKKLLTLLLLLTAFLSNAQNTLNNVGLTSVAPASVAFSLRQLSTSYTGPLVRIKIGSTNVFYDVYPDASTKKFSLSSKISASVSTYNAATSSTDAAAYGDYYQLGRPADGHQTKYLTNNNSYALVAGDRIQFDYAY